MATTNHDGADSNDFRELEDKANLKPPSNLMSLMQVYREAILNGDSKTVSNIEAKISIVEKEKNELVQKNLVEVCVVFKVLVEVGDERYADMVAKVGKNGMGLVLWFGD
ncbi:GrpE protein-like protein [Forsythia ovata]|uniref:GrpE protein-like protein n=1 Tax=Forsythia ovata TaxID=205694 RepID=A0ABD1RL85_9LAMI